MQLDLIRNKGNHRHNFEVLEGGKGVMVPSEQSREPVNVKEYLHCEALLKKRALWRHLKRCKLANDRKSGSHAEVECCPSVLLDSLPQRTQMGKSGT